MFYKSVRRVKPVMYLNPVSISVQCTCHMHLEWHFLLPYGPVPIGFLIRFLLVCRFHSLLDRYLFSVRLFMHFLKSFGQICLFILTKMMLNKRVSYNSLYIQGDFRNLIHTQKVDNRSHSIL